MGMLENLRPTDATGLKKLMNAHHRLLGRSPVAGTSPPRALPAEQWVCSLKKWLLQPVAALVQSIDVTLLCRQTT